MNCTILLSLVIGLPLDLDHADLGRVSQQVIKNLRGGGRSASDPALGLLDETGTYLFNDQGRYNLKSGIGAPYRTYVSFTGPRSEPTSYGPMESSWVTGQNPDPARYMSQEVRSVYYSIDGASLWVLSGSASGSTATAFGMVRMAREKPGYTGLLSTDKAYLHPSIAMGTDGQAFALLRFSRKKLPKTRQPGHVPALQGVGDLAIGRLGSNKLEVREFPKLAVGDEFFKLRPLQFDKNRKILLCQETGPTRNRIVVCRVEAMSIGLKFLKDPITDPRRLTKNGRKSWSITNAWLTPRRGNVLAQVHTPSDALNPTRRKPNTLWLYSMKTANWRKVGDYKVRAWSGSNKLFLIGGDRFDDPAWLIKLEE